MDVPQANGQRRGSLDVVRKERWVRMWKEGTKQDHEAAATEQMQWPLRARARIDVPRFGEHVLCKDGEGE